MIGKVLGPYQVLSKLGEGGMGEVYRARDISLNRDVALKILPESFSSDPDRLARFTREAQTLASLNHPNIAQVHGFEESGGVRALIMELVDGEDLSAVIARGPIAVPEALAISAQIAHALETAHESGIVHRDLKPANIKLKGAWGPTPARLSDGRLAPTRSAPDLTGCVVKVLDFGLAKALGPDATPDGSTAATITSPATQIGTVLGTAAYMAPEQARGRPVDKRADIWAFGCVLYEMLTGTRAFPGDNVTDTIAAVVRAEPDWRALPGDLPPTVGVFLRRCLAKPVNDRVQAIGDVRLALEGAFDTSLSIVDGAAGSSVRRAARSILFVGLTAALVAASATTAWMLKPAPSAAPQPMRQFVRTPSPGALYVANTNRDIQITPDGTKLVYLASQNANRALFVWPLDALSATELRKGERFFDPFISPDSKWVGFNDETDFVLRKVPITGGPPVTIAPVGREMAGATWGPDDTIVFAFSGFGQGLMRLAPGARTPVVLTTPNKDRSEVGHYWPEFLPGGRGLIYTARIGQGGAQSQIWALDLRTNTPKKLVETGTGARYSATGHLLFGADNSLWAVPFDSVALEIRGEAVVVSDTVPAKSSGVVNFAVSSDGSLAYATATNTVPHRRLVWIDRISGAREVANLPPRPYTVARVAPDGSRVALDVRDEGGDIWMWILTRNVLTKITDDPSSDADPNWTSDSRRIVFQSQRLGVPNMFAQNADGTGTVDRLTQSANAQYPTGVLRDGTVIYWELGSGSPLDIFMLPPGPQRTPVPLLHTAYRERNPEPSPDGKWLAYGSNENQSGQLEVYVRPFPNVAAGKVQISSGGGLYPMWLPGTGAELFYVRPDGRLVSVPMRDGVPSGPTRVALESVFYTAPNPRTFDISRDGKRFLVIENLAEDVLAQSGIVVVLNWVEGLSRRPTAVK